MKYDVFISYSREDKAFAQSVCQVFDAYKKYYKFECFFDTSEIRIKNEYLERIANAISQSKSMLFLASENSYSSRFCAKELLFADEFGVGIYRYCLDKSKAPQKIDFLLIDQHYLEAALCPIEEMVCQVLADTLQQDIKPLSELQKEDNDEVSISPITTPVKTYKVGDYYNENGKEGVVFEVWDNGRHGKIVSMTQSTSKLQWVSDKIEENRFVGADNENNGMHNMALISSIQDWQNKYPAFKWCVDLGEGWYLPSIEELKAFTLDPYVYYDVNRTIVANGGVKLYNIKSDWGFYWSSTEKNKQRSTGEYCACYVHMYQGDAFHHNKGDYYSVRAVATF